MSWSRACKQANSEPNQCNDSASDKRIAGAEEAILYWSGKFWPPIDTHSVASYCVKHNHHVKHGNYYRDLWHAPQEKLEKQML